MPVSSAKVWETTNCFAMCHWSTWGQPSGDFMFKDLHWLKRILEHGNIEHTHTHAIVSSNVYTIKSSRTTAQIKDFKVCRIDCVNVLQERFSQHDYILPFRAYIQHYTTISILIYVHITRWTSSSNIECNIECLAESDSSGKKRISRHTDRKVNKDMASSIVYLDFPDLSLATSVNTAEASWVPSQSARCGPNGQSSPGGWCE